MRGVGGTWVRGWEGTSGAHSQGRWDIAGKGGKGLKRDNCGVRNPHRTENRKDTQERGGRGRPGRVELPPDRDLEQKRSPLKDCLPSNGSRQSVNTRLF